MDRARRVDMLLAQHLFGGEVFEEVDDDGSRPLRRRYIDEHRTSWVAEQIERYSTTYSGMGRVIEAMGRRHYLYIGHSWPGKPASSGFVEMGVEHGRMGAADGDTLPAAVAEAALKALGVAVPERGEGLAPC